MCLCRPDVLQPIVPEVKDTAFAAAASRIAFATRADVSTGADDIEPPADVAAAEEKKAEFCQSNTNVQRSRTSGQ